MKYRPSGRNAPNHGLSTLLFRSPHSQRGVSRDESAVMNQPRGISLDESALIRREPVSWSAWLSSSLLPSAPLAFSVPCCSVLSCSSFLLEGLNIQAVQGLILFCR